MNNKIFKILIVMGGFAGLLSPIAHAQDSEKWKGWTVSGGITSHNKIDKQAYAATWSGTEESDVNVTTGSGFFSFGYVWGFSASSALDVSRSILGSVAFERANCSLLCEDTDVSVGTIDISYIHRIALSDDTKIMLRVGSTTAALSGTVYLGHYDEGGTLLGAGVHHKKFLFEYKLYPIKFGEEISGTKYEFYSGASVFSVGYQF